jgi:hypothetical protein
MSKRADRSREPRDYLHVLLPVSTKDLLRRLNYETRVPITHILVRVLGRAQEAGLLEQWINAGELPTPETYRVSPAHRSAQAVPPAGE